MTETPWSPRVCCVIPARYASTRLPGKPLAEVEGIPLVMWVYRSAVSSEAFSDVCVATDHRGIARAVRRHGGTAVLTSGTHRSGTERVHEAVAEKSCDYVVNLQGDEPEIPPGLLRDFVAALADIDDNCLLTCVSNATIEEWKDPHVVKAVLNARSEALYFSRAPLPYGHGEKGGSVYKHAGIYGFTAEGIRRYCALPGGTLAEREDLEQLRALEHGMKIKCLLCSYSSRGIDTPGDLEAFRRRARR